ncbi:tRNA (adenosine(37)-N6)-threonylcarbamoyltransferase complex dimerization subunit type 1 TsaB [Amycolatopsis sp. K13G38]|uniref:tRNA (Adenosine(37)-N6)-threonylcarbamoyltransferase complex dimerization subunit type 1 TsaB n=1 Tax=Amycolatopsis acididurans TaxID=2724524 RepID=A0ABX1JHR4_9PSEU|nr:tRNA (adenosine(37)-N6)-threonylcarbamoyltransferase complex dimerization subunit type 1 TsaB [Amycolatopsis acididurans]NKQ58111.1 tRNA (adenosine(37)-N6)-threonylcarbamoyltransferase complex dimerization subunit type 1 TsaB [Amycolatopsis acididurans]
MLVLAIDTSTPAVTAGVATLAGTEVTVLAERVTLNPRAHGELITPHVLDAAREADVTLRGLDAIVCGVGPGPFTGLRAGMATAAALGHGLALNVYPVCGLDAIAAEVGSAEPFAVVTDARRKEIYWAAYSADGSRQDGPHVEAPRELGYALAAGDGARLYEDRLGARVVEPYYPATKGLVTAAASVLTAGEPPAPLTPLYLRRPDATEPGARKRVTVS